MATITTQKQFSTAMKEIAAKSAELMELCLQHSDSIPAEYGTICGVDAFGIFAQEAGKIAFAAYCATDTFRHADNVKGRCETEWAKGWVTPEEWEALRDWADAHKRFGNPGQIMQRVSLEPLSRE